MTEEGIRAKEHLCPKCGGKGKLPLGLGYAFVECDICHGTGKEEITNEQWFIELSTEEKARFLVGAIKDCGWCMDGGQPRKWSFCGDSMKNCPAESVEGMERWLKEKNSNE